MDRSLYIAAISAHHNTLSLTSHSNNLANVSSTGFKRDFNQTRAMQIFGEHLPTRIYALSENPATDFKQGSMQQTDNPLDITANNGGFIAVQNAHGEERYVSSTSLQVSANGDLLANGLPVLSSSGLINLPSNQIRINADGSIDAGNLQNIAQIKLVKPNPQTLFKDNAGLIASHESQENATNVGISSGFLETSNVNLVEEMTQVLELTKHFELNIKMMHAADTNQQAANSILSLT